MFLSIILPVKEEPDSTLIQDLQEVIKMPCELLIQREKGISNAVWCGIQKATGDVIAIMDGDGTHKSIDLWRMLAIMSDDKADLVIGSRYYDCYSWWRRQITRVANWLARNMLGLPYRDPMTSFFVGKKELMKFKPSKSCKFGLEILLHAPYGRVVRVVEFPIIRELKPYHKSHLSWKEGFYLIWLLLRLKYE